MAAATLIQAGRKEEDKIRAVLKALLQEPIIAQCSPKPLVDRLSKLSGVYKEDVWRITGLKKPSDSQEEGS